MTPNDTTTLVHLVGFLAGVVLYANAAFAVMALHLSQHTTGTESWPTELLGHHASLPLALVIPFGVTPAPAGVPQSALSLY